MTKALISIQDGSVLLAGHPVLSNINISVFKGTHWAITGPSGSGKTTLLNAIAGNIALNKGKLTYYFESDSSAANQPLIKAKPIAFVSLKHNFRDTSNTTSFYYQQRYNSFDAENSATVAEYLAMVNTTHTSGIYWTSDLVIDKLNLNSLLSKHLIKLSNGETRRLMIAAALLKNPSVLLLDNPLTGLDAGTRQSMNLLFNEIAASGISIILTASIHDIPDVITSVASLSNGQLVYSGSKSNYELHEQHHLPVHHPMLAHVKQLLQHYPTTTEYNYLVHMKQVNVNYGDAHILKNINWQVLPGERWALLGENGAGKSTLLSLINGDHPQAYANDIVLFDKKRGTGESIWDIKKNIGFISPELYQYFPLDQSCLQVIESGYYDTLGLFRPSHAAKVQTALQWMKALQIDTYARKLFRQIPAGAQRLCLLARALIKCPPLLILDEPCQGLDDEQQGNFKQVIDFICASSTVSIIYVTHYMHEIPESVQHTLKLNKGSVVSVE